jgi:hypothetical protein
MPPAMMYDEGAARATNDPSISDEGQAFPGALGVCR